MYNEKRVLIVDDEPAFRVGASRTLKKNGYDVVAAASAAEAEEHLKSEKFYTCIFDWNLDPDGRKGGPYTEGVVHTAIGKGIPVTVSSGTDDETGRLEALQRQYGNRLIVMGKELFYDPEVLTDYMNTQARK